MTQLFQIWDKDVVQFFVMNKCVCNFLKQNHIKGKILTVNLRVKTPLRLYKAICSIVIVNHSKKMNYDTICVPMKKTKKAMRLIREEMISRIEIQQLSLDTYSREIFENVGRVLSLVKFQLLTLQSVEKSRSGDVMKPL